MSQAERLRVRFHDYSKADAPHRQDAPATRSRVASGTSELADLFSHRTRPADYGNAVSATTTKRSTASGSTPSGRKSSQQQQRRVSKCSHCKQPKKHHCVEEPHPHQGAVPAGYKVCTACKELMVIHRVCQQRLQRFAAPLGESAALETTLEGVEQDTDMQRPPRQGEADSTIGTTRRERGCTPWEDCKRRLHELFGGPVGLTVELQEFEQPRATAALSYLQQLISSGVLDADGQDMAVGRHAALSDALSSLGARFTKSLE